MDLFECIRKRRTIRLFQDRPVDRGDLLDLADLARRSPSAANKQPLEYLIVDDKGPVGRLFDFLAWAGYIQPKRNPPAGKRPTAYIVVLIDKARTIGDYAPVDAGAAVQTILLAACAKGLGACWIGSVQRDPVRLLLSIPDTHEIHSVVALGYPDEDPVMEDMEDEDPNAIKYFLDDSDRLHVPKRSLEAIVHLNGF